MDVSVHTDAQTRMAYEPGIDGIRALAVVAVLLFHADLTWAKGGFLGVSVFFTLSGYLITTLLLMEWSTTETISLKNFYGRRLRRLAPASLVTIAMVLLAAPWLTEPVQRALLPGDALSAVTYVANWRFVWSGQSYAELFAAPSPLQHFWSLAIEEQFYIVYPLLMLGATRVIRTLERLIHVMFGMLGVSVVISLLISNVDRVYYGTDTRAAELLVGGILAAFAARKRLCDEYTATTVGGLGLVAFVVLVATTPQSATWLYRGGFVGVSVVSCALIIGATGSPVWRDAIGTPVLVMIGKVSYGLYLIHWPVYLWLNEDRVGTGGLPLFMLRIAVTAALTVVSYRVVEQPIRLRSFLRTPEIALSAFSVAVVATLSIAVFRAAVTDDVAPPSEAAIERPDAVAFDDAGAVLFSPSAEVAAQPVPLAPVSTAPVVTEPPKPIRALVLGTSPDLVNRLREESRAGANTLNGRQIEVIDGISPGCPIAPALSIAGPDGTEVDVGSCTPTLELWPTIVAREQPDVVLIGLSDLDRVPVRRAEDTALPTTSDDAIQRLRWVADELGVAVASLRDSGVPLVLTDVGPPGDFLGSKLFETDLREQFASLVSADQLGADGALAATMRAVVDADPASSTSLKIMVAGDSTSIGFAEALYDAGDGEVEVLSTGRDGCPLAAAVQTRWWKGAEFDAAKCPRVAESWPEYLEQFDPDVVVIVTSLMEQSEQRYIEGGEWFVAGDEEFRVAHDQTINDIQQVVAAHGVPIIVADSPPIDRGEFKTSQMAGDLRIAAWNIEIQRWTQQWSNVALLPYAAPLLDAESRLGSIRADGVHSDRAAMTELMRSSYLPQIRQLLDSSRLALRTSGCLVGPRTDETFELSRCQTGAS
jgi:peptidoglycan/LPS O-acetylase OafA/YrhL